MTRQEALDNVFNDCSLNGDMYQAQWTAIAKWINKIFDDFEELSGCQLIVDNHKTCEGCKHFIDSMYCSYMFEEFDKKYFLPKDFCCNRWESKE